MDLLVLGDCLVDAGAKQTDDPYPGQARVGAAGAVWVA
jgi:hypothetical protein